MLCSNQGTMLLKKGVPEFHIESNDHDLFLTKKDALKHKDWLMSMKDRFMTHKKELKEITTPFLKDGNWVKPISEKNALEPLK